MRSALRRLRSSERGFTLIEILIAALLAAVGITAVIGTFDSSRRLVSSAEQVEAASHQGEREMERILALPYEDIALTSAPPESLDETDPNYFVKPDAVYQWDQGATGPRENALVVDGTGALDPTSGWVDGANRLSGTVHRYVTEVDDPCCPGVDQAKRVTLAVTLNGDAKMDKPILMSSIVEDPAASTP